MKSNIFDLIKFDEEELAPLNILVPKELKSDFKKICKAKKMSMTSAIIKFMEVTVHTAVVENLDFEDDNVDLDD